MRAAPVVVAFTAACALSLALVPAALAQTAPTQAEITKALRPVPPAMQKGEQGLPTPGTAPMATPPRTATRASLGGGPAPAAEKTAAGNALAVLPGCSGAQEEAPKAAATFPTITFEFASARLKPQSIATLQNLGKSIKEDFPPNNTFLIEGHTDSAGTFAINEELSRQRAEAVKDYLVQHMGIKADQLGVAGLGYCRLANPADPRGAENRRVVIVNTAG